MNVCSLYGEKGISCLGTLINQRLMFLMGSAGPGRGKVRAWWIGGLLLGCGVYGRAKTGMSGYIPKARIVAEIGTGGVKTQRDMAEYVSWGIDGVGRAV